MFLRVPGNDEVEAGGWETLQTQWFAVADHLLEDLGWLPGPQ